MQDPANWNWIYHQHQSAISKWVQSYAAFGSLNQLVSTKKKCLDGHLGFPYSWTQLPARWPFTSVLQAAAFPFGSALPRAPRRNSCLLVFSLRICSLPTCQCVELSCLIINWLFPKMGIPHFIIHLFNTFSTFLTIQLLGYPHDLGTPQLSSNRWQRSGCKVVWPSSKLACLGKTNSWIWWLSPLGNRKCGTKWDPSPSPHPPFSGLDCCPKMSHKMVKMVN